MSTVKTAQGLPIDYSGEGHNITSNCPAQPNSYNAPNSRSIAAITAGITMPQATQTQATQTQATQTQATQTQPTHVQAIQTRSNSGPQH